MLLPSAYTVHFTEFIKEYNRVMLEPFFSRQEQYLNAPILLKGAEVAIFLEERGELKMRYRNVRHYDIDLSCSYSLQTAVNLLPLGSLYFRRLDRYRSAMPQYNILTLYVSLFLSRVLPRQTEKHERMCYVSRKCSEQE